MRTKRMSKTKTMKRAKKLLCGLLTGCMLVGMMPGAAVAETEMPTTAETPESPAAPAALSAPNVSETPTTPASPTAIEASKATAADSEPAGQSDADGDEYGISLLSDTENESVSYIERKWVLYEKKVEAAPKMLRIIRSSETVRVMSHGAPAGM